MWSRTLTLTKRWILSLLGDKPLIGLFYLPRYIAQFYKYKRQSKNETINIIDSYPCLTDCISHTPFDAHYFYQGAWLARQLSDSRPELHVDIGSSVLTMGVVSANVPTVFVDFRPLNAQLPNLINIAGSIISLPFASAAIASLSCMHVIEHIGLGRYGDPIDPFGAHKAASELERVLKPGGRLYLTTPVGRERVCFNAHRIFNPNSLVSMFASMDLISFSCVDDSGKFMEACSFEDAEVNEYACGLFYLQKRS